MQNSKIGICVATSSLGKGGAEKQLYLLLKHLDRSLFEPQVLTFADGPWRSPIEQLQIPVHILQSRSRAGRLLSGAYHLMRTKPAVLHCFGASAGFILRPAAVAASIPCIIGSERYSVETKNRAKLISEKILGYVTDYVICNAQHSATYYEENHILPRRKIKVIKNGIEADEFSEWISPATPAIGYLANLREGKNHEFLVHAFSAIRNKVPGAKLLLAGDGSRRKFIESLVKSLDLENSVELLGTITDQSAFFRRISVYCHISLFEGIPNSVMEAMARGLPCVTSDIPGNRELITHEKTGLLVNPSSIGELSDAVLRLLDDATLAKAYGHAARGLILEKFSIPEMVNATVALYPNASSAAQRGKLPRMKATESSHVVKQA